ncbi:50S ribosomal protein L3 [Candidatus Parcubacteria bacterium]|nr:MAG: 50S ribosomal protein L3 [Candidatus Parcubacteria bacterium]
MKFILGKKVEMTQIWKDEKVVAVTKIKTAPCTVVQVKDEKTDGYKAVQVGFDLKKEKNIKKPQKGHMKGLENFRYLREFRINNNEEILLKKGDRFDISSFEAGESINMTSVSKGRGFQGVVKRHGFKGQIKTHGTKDQVRMPGSIGATGPAHVFKGTRMGGRMGGDQVTIKDADILKIEDDTIFVKGGVPGARNSLVLINAKGDLKILEAVKKEEKEKKEENIEETVEKAVEKKAEVKKEEVKKEAKEEKVEDKKEEALAKEEKKEEAKKEDK